jgi:hypothetical protein
VPESFACGQHRIFIYARGGVTPITELTPVESVRWERVRDDISTASCAIPTHTCCQELGDLRTILHELHIERNGEIVWQGPITRIEYEHDLVRIYAEDILWQAKRMVLEQGYTQAYPNLWDVVARMDWLIRDQCFARFGDPWNMVPHLHPYIHPGNPKTSRTVYHYQYTVWEDFDKYAEDSGTDYTVVNRDLYYFDNHLAWNILPELDENFISQFPRVIEYGNSAATRAFITNGEGQAGIAQVPDHMGYGVVDDLTTNLQDGNPEGPVSPEEVANWAVTAAHSLDGRLPPPVSLSIPDNTTLLPGAPWTINELVPGSWFQVSVDRLCRNITAWQRLHHVLVTESAPNGEEVQFTAVSPPSTMIMP